VISKDPITPQTSFATLPLPTPFVAFLKLTASSRTSAPPSDSPKCLRFGHWLILCSLNIPLLTYLLSYLQTCRSLPCEIAHGQHWKFRIS